MYYKNHDKDIRGLDKDTEIVELDSDLIELKTQIDEELSKLAEEIKSLKTGLSSLDIQRKGKQFLSSTIDLHDVKKINERTLGSKLNPNASMFGNMYEEIERVYKEAPVTSPFNIPVLHDHMGTYSGRTEYVQAKTNEILVDSIHLPRNKNEYSPQIYVRELIDQQIRTTKGAIQDINNQDIVSFFFEYLSLDTDLKTKIYKYVILTNLSSNIDYLLSIQGYTDIDSIKDHIQRSSTKIISTLKVFDLIDLFNYSDMISQRDILDEMQMVLDGMKPLEEVLEKHSINPKRGMFVLRSTMQNN